jgi:Na+:H+ antiporter, NhaA family
VVGKAVGVLGGTWLAARFTRAELNPDLAWADVAALASLAGVGFTVSLLIGELAFAGDAELTDEVKAAVLVGSLISALIAALLLRLRNNRYRRMSEVEGRDEDLNSIPDCYEQDYPEYHHRMAAIHEAKAAKHRERARKAQPRTSRAGNGAHDGDDGRA